MKGYEQWLIQYMGGSAHLIIPVYQRNYDWKMEQCRQLYDDLVSVARKGLNSHFFGSVVSVSDPGGQMMDYLIIDGQQRLTTVSLLMLAIHRLLEAGAVRAEQKNLSSLLLKRYLIDEFGNESQKIKLKPIKDDQRAFVSLFDDDAEQIAESNLTINYRYFCERIRRQEISVDALYSAISKLQIINITLNHEDDPQLIFESLNSTGLALSEGDKIRNYILMGLSLHEQEHYYTKYWNEIEKNTGYDVSSFVRDYLSIKQQTIPNLKNVYPSFKSFRQEAERDGQTTEDILKDMLAYARRYHRLIQPDVTSPRSSELDWCIYRLNRLKTTVTRPFFLEILRLKDAGTLGEADILSIFRQTEVYLFRRTICDLPTNALNKIFLFLHRDIVNLDGTTENYCEKLIYTLNGKRESGRFPTDEEFRAALSQKSVYLMRGENRKYLFERLENGGLKDGSIGVWNKLDSGALSIEHIMPQTLTHGWMEDLGEDFERIYEQWLHRLANLTLTGYNSEYQNARFPEKKAMTGGFEEGGLHINRWIKKQEKWTEAELEQRDAILQDEAVTLWPRQETAYCPPVRQMDRVTLEEDAPLTGKVISRYLFHGIEQSVNSWTEMYQQVLMQLHEKDRSVLTRLARSSDPGEDMSLHFSSQPDQFHSSRKIEDGVYVLTGTDTQSKINMLKKLLPLFGEDPEQLIFCLDEPEQADDLAEGRHGIRKRYWQFAMSAIREATGTFTYSGDTTGNTVSGITTVPGVHPVCVANFNSALVKIYIDVGNYQKNKAIFDRLLAHKAEIEAAYGGALTWNRSDETRASQISDELTEVGIGAEEDWPRMARFHSVQMAKLLRAVQGYLE